MARMPGTPTDPAHMHTACCEVHATATEGSNKLGDIIIHVGDIKTTRGTMTTTRITVRMN